MTLTSRVQRLPSYFLLVANQLKLLKFFQVNLDGTIQRQDILSVQLFYNLSSLLFYNILIEGTGPLTRHLYLNHLASIA